MKTYLYLVQHNVNIVIPDAIWRHRFNVQHMIYDGRQLIYQLFLTRTESSKWYLFHPFIFTVFCFFHFLLQQNLLLKYRRRQSSCQFFYPIVSFLILHKEPITLIFKRLFHPIKIDVWIIIPQFLNPIQESNGLLRFLLYMRMPFFHHLGKRYHIFFILFFQCQKCIIYIT